MTEDPDELFRQLVQDGEQYEDAERRRRLADLNRDLIARGGQL